jgi:hypothetical protein
MARLIAYFIEEKQSWGAPAFVAALLRAIADADARQLTDAMQGAYQLAPHPKKNRATVTIMVTIWRGQASVPTQRDSVRDR